MVLLCLLVTANSFNLSPALSLRPGTAFVTALWSSEEEAAAPEENPKKKKKQQPAGQEPMVMDISKLDIRVGYIERCWEHEEADKLYCEEIDLGEEGGPRKIASGLKAHYAIDDMVGKKV